MQRAISEYSKAAMQVQQFVQRFRENSQKFGRSAAVHDAEILILNRIGEFEIMKAMVLRLSDVASDAFDAPGFEGRFATRAELSRFVSAGKHDLTEEFLDEAFTRGDRCYALFAGDELASYGWYSEKPTAISAEQTLHFDPVYTYMYKGFTLHAYRGKRLHAVGMCRALKEFTSDGKRGLISYVRSDNFASLRSCERLGYRIFGDVYLGCIAGRAFSFATSGCKAYGFYVTDSRSK